MLLQIKNLHVSINGKEILKGINLEVNKGEVHAIMGPNGTGKSTLAAVIAGKDGYEVTQGEILYNGKDILSLPPEVRAQEGIFLGFQYPVEIPGVSMTNFMRSALNEIRKYHGQEPIAAKEFLARMAEKKELVEITAKLNNRSVNEGFSGGEKKKNEIYQMAMLEPQLAILDETDSGLDIDALRIVANGVNKLKTKDNATVVITHYQRLLDYIVPDFVHVLFEGKVVLSGGKELALELEDKGYDWIKKRNRKAVAMSNEINSIPMQDKIPQWFDTVVGKEGHAFSGLQDFRASALADFNKLGFPHKKMEKWRNTDLKNTLPFDYSMATQDFLMKDILGEVFECDVHELDSYVMNLYKGRFVFKEKPLHKLDGGVIVGSLSAAFDQYPDLVNQHFGKYAKTEHNAFNALNTALFLDGLFVYVPKNVIVEKPLQLINAVGTTDEVFVQNRNLIILEENSALTFIHCDDSYNYKRSLTNSVTEVILGANASIDHYRLQNINNNSSLVSSLAVEQARDSRLSTNSIILNGGLIRNETLVKLNGEGANADIMGVYLADKNQHIDNQVYVDHAVPHCTSNELFKGILDDYARAVFNGHILVRKDAQKTLAFQNNANIILTDKAMINTKPFLEIYADDVKCSHGATVGQLDENALFYIRQRGISEDNARMLLMYAFAADVTHEIKIDTLRERVEDMVKKRLRGELSICDQCVLQCSSPEKYNFEIDMNKI